MNALWRERSPELARIADAVAAQNPFQRKRIETFVAGQDDRYFEFAESLSRTLNHSLLARDEDRIEAAACYNRMCMDFLREQVRFRKTGTYLLQDASIAEQDVYSRPEIMRYYMVGLLLSYLFWPNHYAIYRFLSDHLAGTPVRRYLEVAPGHGLFTIATLTLFPHLNATLIDISPTSLQVTGEVVTAFGIPADRTRAILGDFLTTSTSEGGFDFIALGEVLEHVNEPRQFLERARGLLAPNGRIFMTTCANCPAIDHVYHFHNLCEIRKLIRATGLGIVRELALPSDPIPADRWEAELTTINYAAILKARTGAEEGHHEGG